MKGEHIAKYAKSLGTGSEDYQSKFSKYIAKGVAPEKISEHFTKVKAEITAVIKGGKSPAPAEAEEVTEEPIKKAEPTVAKEAPTPKKAPVKKTAAKKETAPAKGEKAPAKKAKKPAKEEAPVEAKKAPKKVKEKAPKEEKPAKKGGKKA